MRWYTGSIVDAVNLSKSKNAYFVVYTEGTDEKSIAMTKVINQSNISSRLEDERFVAIKVTSDSQEYKQFAEIYKLVPVPSMFFIGDNGAPVEIVHGEKPNLSEHIITTIDSLALKKGSERPSNSNIDKPASTSKASTSSFISAEQENIAKTSEKAPEPPIPDKVKETPANEEGYKVVCEDGVCRKVKIEDAPIETTEETPTVAVQSTPEEKPDLSIDEKVERAKELLEKKRIEKMEEEKRLQKQKELERRAQGQGMAELKKWQHEQELKNLKEERMKEKLDNQNARAKILQQIAQDRAEKQALFAPHTPEAPKPETSKPKISESTSNVTKIQFRMADGTTHTTQVEPDSTLGHLRQYVRQNVQKSGPFTLSTMYPRQILDENKDTESMRVLGLHPSAVLLLIKGKLSSSSPSGNSAPVANFGFVGMVQQFLFSLIVQPALALWTWISSFVNPRAPDESRRRPNPSATTTPNTENDDHTNQSDETEVKRRRTAPTSGTTSIRREGNTYRLKDNDSDDENNTWNGNSTQQM